MTARRAAPLCALLALALATTAGCHRGGTGVVSLAFDATRGTLKADHVAVTLTYGGKQTMVDVPIHGAAIPPRYSVSLLFEASVSGDVKADATAQFGTSVAASGSTTFTVTPGSTTTALIDFGGESLDMSVPPDLTEPRDLLPPGWTVVQLGKTYNLLGVWVGDTEAVAVGLEPDTQFGVVLSKSLPGGEWTQIKSAPADYPLKGVYGVGREIFAVGGGMTVVHRMGDGTTWKAEVVDDNPNVSFNYLNTVWAAGPNDVYTAGDIDSNVPLIYHGGNANGTWEKQKLTGAANPVWFIWGRGNKDIFAVGDSGGAWHSIGGGAAWSPLPGFGADNLYSVWGDNLTDVFVLAEGGAVWRRQNGIWKRNLVDNASTFEAMWGSALDDIYVVGDSGVMWRFDGTDWKESGPKPPVQNLLFSIHGNAAGDVVIVGKEGLIIEGKAGTL